ASAQDVMCLSNLRTIGQGLSLYAASYRGMYPWGLYRPGSNQANYYDWSKSVKEMLTRSPQGGDGNPNNAALTGAFTCPRASKPAGSMAEVTNSIHYASNPMLLPSWNSMPPVGSDPFWSDPANASVNRKTYPVARLGGRAAEVIVIMDASQRLFLDGNSSIVATVLSGPSNPAPNNIDWRAVGYYDPNWTKTVGGRTRNMAHPIQPGPNRDPLEPALSGGNDPGNRVSNIRWRHGAKDPGPRVGGWDPFAPETLNMRANFLFGDGHVEGRAARDVTYGNISPTRP
ncbi:MAG TPA: hypothetical protein PKB10_03380, partial [Tepidisphaeraceae bacterium]|nr:hypothetical protein [Tepidisphaeraceae bacterium]